MKDLITFYSCLIKNRKVIFELAQNDLKTRNLGSALGFFWAFLNPLLSIVIIWAIFEFGIRGQNSGQGNSVVWILIGLITWQVLTDGIGASTNAILERPYLVKKIKFDTELLPLIKVLNSLKIHFPFIIFGLVVAYFHQSLSFLSLLQLPYYIFCLAFLLTSIGILTASLVVFYRDIQNLITFFLQLGFWGTPILWDPSMLDKYHLNWLLMVNPFHYVISGYRSSILGGDFFWINYSQGLIFWAESCALLYFGVWTFKKLQPSFSDVL